MIATQEKIVSSKQASALVTGWRIHWESIVFTNGCFDILHLGHVDYLEKARNLGKRLVVGINSDDSVQRLKGESRPILPQEARARVIAALEFVDAVVIFEEDTPYELIKLLQPDILVKGGDYKPEEIVGYEIVTKHGGKVLTLDLVNDYSTTAIGKKLALLD